MKALIRGFTFILALGLATVSLAQTAMKDQASWQNVTSGQSYPFYNNTGSGTITLSYSFAGTPSGVSIAVKGCAADGTNCTVLTPIAGSAPYTTSSSGQQQFLGGYALYIVTPTFSGTTLTIYEVGIQAKVSSGSGGNTATGLNGATAPNSANGLGTNSSGQLIPQTSAMLSAIVGAGGLSFGGQSATSIDLTVANADLINEGIVASASNITPNTQIIHLTGTTSIATITPRNGGLAQTLFIIADAVTPFTAGTATFNIKSAFTTAAGTLYTCAYSSSTTLWYCK